MQPKKYVTKSQLKTIFDSNPSVNRVEILDEFLNQGYVVEGYNEPKPNLAQKVADVAIGGAANIGSTVVAPVFDRVTAGVKTAFNDKSYSQNLADEQAFSKQSQDSGAGMVFGRDAQARDLSTGKGWEQLGGDALSTAATVMPAGKALEGATWTAKAAQGAKIGATVGAMGGAGMSMQVGNDLGTVAKDTLVGAGVGAGAGAAIPAISAGASAVGSAAKKGAQKVTENVIPDPAALMQRVARISKGKQAAFKDTAGESVGEYLVNRGIYGDKESIVNQLWNRFINSKQTADDALAKLGGKYKTEAVDTALNELLEKKIKVSAPGAVDPDLSLVKKLVGKNSKDGLSMTEINQVKRLYEKSVKMDFIKENLPEQVQRANNIDSSIRNWQFSQADRLGLKNLADINKETRLARQLMDNLGEEMAGQAGNNFITLTDAIIASGGSPEAIAFALGRKALTSDKAASMLAKKIAPKVKINEPAAQFVNSGINTKVQNFKDYQKAQDIILGPKNQNSILQEPLKQVESMPYNEAIIPRNTKNTKAFENPLIQEAKKYESSEEFITAQGTPFYHGTNADFNEFDIKKIGTQTDDGMFGKGFYFTPNEKMAEQAPFGAKAKFIKEVNLYIKNPLEINNFKTIEDLAYHLNMSESAFVKDGSGMIRPLNSQINQFTSKVKDAGYDGIYVRRNGVGDEIVVFNPEQIKTKSQLEQIWKEANIDEAVIPQLTEKVKEVVSKDPSKAVQVIKDILSSMPDMSTLNKNELIKELVDWVNEKV